MAQQPKMKKDASITFRMIKYEKVLIEEYAGNKRIPTGILIRQILLELIEKNK